MSRVAAVLRRCKALRRSGGAAQERRNTVRLRHYAVHYVAESARGTQHRSVHSVSRNYQTHITVINTVINTERR
jgi:hypothetical protein